MDVIKSIFERKTVNTQKLISYGFEMASDVYTYHTTLPGSGFLMTVNVSDRGRITTAVIDPALDEPYTLHLADGAAGSFVGNVKMEYEQALREISEQCFEPDVFKARQTKELLEYVRAAYGDDPEYLWKKFPDNAIWRRKDNEKWYGVILTVSRRKLGLDSDETAEIIDLRYPPEKLDKLVDDKIYFRGWHMNKKHWYTVILDGSVATEALCRRIDESYLLAKK